jgi:hypothetical protein
MRLEESEPSYIRASPPKIANTEVQCGEVAKLKDWAMAEKRQIVKEKSESEAKGNMGERDEQLCARVLRTGGCRNS